MWLSDSDNRNLHFVVRFFSEQKLRYSIEGMPGSVFSLIQNKYFGVNAEFIDNIEI